MRGSLDPDDPAERLMRLVRARLREVRARRELGPPPHLLVAIDGRSGTGKSTIARRVTSLFVELTGAPVASVIEGDAFYTGGSAATWDARSAAESADKCIDWRRQRTMLQALQRTGIATWGEFDWEDPHWDSDEVPLVEGWTSCASPVLVVEGVYSARPELFDLFDLRVLIKVSAKTREARLRVREGSDFDPGWAARWGAAEEHYFEHVVSESSFDLVLEND